MIEGPIRFCPLCGTSLIERYHTGRMRPACPNCGWVYFPDPKVAAAALISDGQNVLLARRVNDPQRGLWTLPAGFVDAGEDPARAAERECFEETGLSVRVMRVLDVIAGREHERGADFVIVYQAEILGGIISPSDDADAVEWFEYDKLPPLAFIATTKVLVEHRK